LTQWTYLHRWGSQRRAGLRAFFASVVVLTASFKAASVWGEIQAHARLRGRPRPINDSWVAACCLA
jgi:predicted nucleic acid-binding protein